MADPSPLRRYREADTNRILEVWEAASRVAHAFLDDGFFAKERRAIRDEYLPVVETWVWERDGRILGFVSMIGDELGAIFVDPSAQGAGVGTALLEHVQSGRSQVELEVFERNDIGRKFYARREFEQVGRSVHETTGEALLRLRWTAP